MMALFRLIYLWITLIISYWSTKPLWIWSLFFYISSFSSWVFLPSYSKIETLLTLKAVNWSWIRLLFISLVVLSWWMPIFMSRIVVSRRFNLSFMSLDRLCYVLFYLIDGVYVSSSLSLTTVGSKLLLKLSNYLKLDYFILPEFISKSPC